MPVEEEQLKSYENNKNIDFDGADGEHDNDFDDDGKDLVFHDLNEEEIDSDVADVPLIRRNRYGRDVRTQKLVHS